MQLLVRFQTENGMFSCMVVRSVSDYILRYEFRTARFVVFTEIKEVIGPSSSSSLQASIPLSV